MDRAGDRPLQMLAIPSQLGRDWLDLGTAAAMLEMRRSSILPSRCCSTSWYAEGSPNPALKVQKMPVWCVESVPLGCSALCRQGSAWRPPAH